MHPAALVCSLLLLMAALPEARAAAPLPRGHLWVYIGTYTARTSEGIYLFSLNPKTGELSPRGLAAPAKQPSFLAIHPNGRHLYAVNELTQFEGKPSGAVSAFAIDRATGRLEFLNQQPSEGGAPCHLVTDRKGRQVGVPVAKVAYVEIGSPHDDRRIGFGGS